MKYKKLTVLSSKLLSKLHEKNKNWFTTREVYDLFPDIPPKSISQQLMRMTNDGVLMRIKESVYYMIPFEQDPECYLPNWHLMAEPLAGNEHYIGYYSAMQIHNLITQPALTEQIVVPKQIKPTWVEIRKVNFQFIYHNDKHFFGYKNVWIDDFNRVSCSDLEKTFIDCLYKPEYAGGIVEVAKALHIARERISHDRLLSAALTFGSQAVIKRLGYLLELLNIDTPLIEELHKLRTSSITVLDTGVPEQGKVLTKWSIKQNVNIYTILSSILT
jgi:predicted transcriptional regulator of viral defense system